MYNEGKSGNSRGFHMFLEPQKRISGQALKVWRILNIGIPVGVWKKRG
jgi:hypothetical protein